MFEFILFANLYQQPQMSCIQVREVADQLVSSDLSEKHKKRALRNLFGKHMRYNCFKK